MADKQLREGDVVDWPGSRYRYRVARIYDDGGVILERTAGGAEEVLLTSAAAVDGAVTLGALP